MCVCKSWAFECVSIFSGNFCRECTAAFTVLPRGVPDVDCVSGTAARSVSLAALGRWDSFQHFNTSDADVEGI